MRITTGYFGRVGKERTKVHLVMEGMPLCGSRVSPESEYQWCSWEIWSPYIECSRCMKISQMSSEKYNKLIIRLLERRNKMSWKKFAKRPEMGGRYLPYETKLMVAVTGSGAWVLNSHTYDALGSPDAVEVFYSDDEKSFAIAASEKGRRDAYKVEPQSSSLRFFTFSASAMARQLKLRGPENHAYVYMGTMQDIGDKRDRKMALVFNITPRAVV